MTIMFLLLNYDNIAFSLSYFHYFIVVYCGDKMYYFNGTVKSRKP